jgi:hypothetical protein
MSSASVGSLVVPLLTRRLTLGKPVVPDENGRRMVFSGLMRSNWKNSKSRFITSLQAIQQ